MGRLNSSYRLLCFLVAAWSAPAAPASCRSAAACLRRCCPAPLRPCLRRWPLRATRLWPCAQRLASRLTPVGGPPRPRLRPPRRRRRLGLKAWSPGCGCVRGAWLRGVPVPCACVACWPGRWRVGVGGRDAEWRVGRVAAWAWAERQIGSGCVLCLCRAPVWPISFFIFIFFIHIRIYLEYTIYNFFLQK